jgi:hypothetical protein
VLFRGLLRGGEDAAVPFLVVGYAELRSVQLRHLQGLQSSVQLHDRTVSLQGRLDLSHESNYYRKIVTHR